MKVYERTQTLAADTPEQLLMALLELVDETEQLISETGEQTAEKIEAIQARIKEAGRSLQRFCGTTRRRVIAGARRTDAAIRSHPYETITLMLGMGILVGRLLRRAK